MVDSASVLWARQVMCQVRKAEEASAVERGRKEGVGETLPRN